MQILLSPLLVWLSSLSVDKQFRRLVRLISDLLDLTKIYTGTLELRNERFPLNKLAMERVQDVLYTNSRYSINRILRVTFLVTGTGSAGND